MLLLRPSTEGQPLNRHRMASELPFAPSAVQTTIPREKRAQKDLKTRFSGSVKPIGLKTSFSLSVFAPPVFAFDFRRMHASLGIAFECDSMCLLSFAFCILHFAIRVHSHARLVF